MTTPGLVKYMFQVHAALMTQRSSEMPVLFTVPCKVITLPPMVVAPAGARFWNVAALRRGSRFSSFLQYLHLQDVQPRRPTDHSPLGFRADPDRSDDVE